MALTNRCLRTAAIAALGTLGWLGSSSAQAATDDIARPEEPAAVAPATVPATAAAAAGTTATAVDRVLADLAGNKAAPLVFDRDDLVVHGIVFKRVANPSTGQAPTEHPVYYAADAVAKEEPNIHGFVEVPFKTAYVTPRGLVVENSGVVIQPVGGLVFPLGAAGDVNNLTFVTGVWNSINSAQDDPNVGPWNEMDFFASFSGSLGTLPATWTLTYGAWNFPTSTVNKPKTEHNLDLKISFDDSKAWGDSGFSLNPYVDFWWAISGSSTVVLGREGDTGYIEVGVVPTYNWKVSSDTAITMAFPVYISFGPEHYWGETNPDGNFGVFSASANLTVPLNFIPARYGHWHGSGGLSYFYLINRNLLEAGEILSGNDNRNVLVLSAGIGVNF